MAPTASRGAARAHSQQTCRALHVHVPCLCGCSTCTKETKEGGQLHSVRTAAQCLLAVHVLAACTLTRPSTLSLCTAVAQRPPTLGVGPLPIMEGHGRAWKGMVGHARSCDGCAQGRPSCPVRLCRAMPTSYAPAVSSSWLPGLPSSSRALALPIWLERERSRTSVQGEAATEIEGEL